MITSGVRPFDRKKLSELSVIITTPFGRRIHPNIIPTPEGFLVNFVLRQVGQYLVSLIFNSKIATPEPYYILAIPESMSIQPPKISLSRFVRAYGLGLISGNATKPCRFTIDTKAAQSDGNLTISIEGPSKVDINCHDNQDGTCLVTYIPGVLGDYKIDIKFDDDPIYGSPFHSKIYYRTNTRFIKIYFPFDKYGSIEDHGQ